MHVKQYVPVPEPTPPKYHSVPVPFKVKDPGQVIKVPVPLAPKTLVKNKALWQRFHASRWLLVFLRGSSISRQ